MGIFNSLPLYYLSYDQGRIAVSNPSLRTCKSLRCTEGGLDPTRNLPSVFSFLSYRVINFIYGCNHSDGFQNGLHYHGFCV